MLFPYFVKRIRVISVTFCYSSDNLESGKNVSIQGKVRENENLRIVSPCNIVCVCFFNPLDGHVHSNHASRGSEAHAIVPEL